MKTLPISTLAIYLGAECQIKVKPLVAGIEDGISIIDPELLAMVQAESVEVECLYLRPLDSMTEEEIFELGRIWYISAESLQSNTHLLSIQNTDHLRSKGFDLGGWIVIMVDGPEFIQPIYHTRWVPSLINAGLSKEATK